MVLIFMNQAIRYGHRQLSASVFWRKTRAVRIFVFLFFVAAAGVAPSIRSLFQDPMEVNIFMCVAGMIVAIGAVAAIGFLALRRFSLKRRT